MWIENDDLKLLDIIFDDEEIVPKNKKGGYKLRHISFFMSNMKAITNVCKSLELVMLGEELPHQYIEVLRKMGLVNKQEEITKYGRMLLKILYYEDNRIIDECNKTNVTVDELPADIPFVIEFFLFSVVKRCLEDRDECERCGIDYNDLASEPIDNLEYFFSNTIDTLKEPTNKNSNLNDLFTFDNDDFYYTIQGMNFSGYEVKRLFRLSKANMEKAWKAYKKVLDTAKSIEESKVRQQERRYYEYAMYYNKLVQKDVRNRVKHSIFNYILLNSIVVQRNKAKIVRHSDFELIMPYDFIEEMFEKYKLRDVYNLVYFEKDSKYITHIVKPFSIDNKSSGDIDSSGKMKIKEVTLRGQHINLGDEVLFVDEEKSKLLKSYVYNIAEIKKDGSDVEVTVERKEKVNTVKEQELIYKIKEAE